MILEAKPADRPVLRPRAVYEAYAAEPQRFQEEVGAVWQYLIEAVALPVSLRLHPEPTPALAWIGDLASLIPNGETCDESALTLFTSGTTGQPKSATHNLAKVLGSKRGGAPDERWLLAYAPHRWAGTSTLLHALRFGARVIVPESLEPIDVIRAGIEYQATHVSMTPSYLRRLQLSGRDLREIPLRQVTFGGEAATQPVLDTARELWPAARVTHVYAATEFGDICSVSDGVAGFPRAKFERPGFALAEDGELVIDARPTGDLWQVQGDRYVFLGRRQEVINVGGAKVFPAVVEAAALSIAGVEEARAFGVKNALLGQVVGLDYRGACPDQELRRRLREKLPKVAWPAQVQRVEAIALTGANKVKRSGE